MKRNPFITTIITALSCVALMAALGACQGAFTDPEAGGTGRGTRGPKRRASPCLYR